MTTNLLKELQETILPRHYRVDLSESVDAGYVLFRKGAYVSLLMPFADVPEGDFRSRKAKSIIRSVMTCIPVIMEKGLSLIYYGDAEKWRGVAHKFTVDKTALRPVILQSIHFIDPSTGEDVNSRTHWGPLKFGFCGELIKDIEGMTKSPIRQDIDSREWFVQIAADLFGCVSYGFA